EAPEGTLVLIFNLVYRMAATAFYSEIVLPASSWYEKHDLSSTDMHPVVHPINPAIGSPWEARTDWDIFTSPTKAVSDLAEQIDLDPMKEVVATPLLHDTPQELEQTLGKIKDWSKGECEPIPGQKMPQIHVVERDYKTIYDKMPELGPNAGKQ
ncbi:molybdopterin-dependent oxidoreductase, partial [Bacillus sp. S1-R2T1-FB]|uniref:molybdopterin-dependent oxidoreductase n=1 Tax=Bacillus sp. S1-R2T1-FB TaxID=1973493 RepID=UPI0015C4FC5E